MKYVLVLFFASLLISCNKEGHKLNSEYVNGISVITIDDCQYLYRSSGYSSLLTHKGNCNFCSERDNSLAIDTVAVLEEYWVSDTTKMEDGSMLIAIHKDFKRVK